MQLHPSCDFLGTGITGLENVAFSKLLVHPAKELSGRIIPVVLWPALMSMCDFSISTRISQLLSALLQESDAALQKVPEA